jgi:hypothetical protein
MSLIITSLNLLVSVLPLYTCSLPDRLHEALTRTQDALPTEKNLEGENILEKKVWNNFETFHSVHSQITQPLSTFNSVHSHITQPLSTFHSVNFHITQPLSTYTN